MKIHVSLKTNTKFRNYGLIIPLFMLYMVLAKPRCKIYCI